MRVEPLKFCWLDLGEGKVCERVAGHDGECSPDPAVDFPIATPAFLDDDEFWAAVRTRGEDARKRVLAMLDGELGDIATEDLEIPTWNCPHCDGKPSPHPKDIENRYCRHCRHFCDDVPS
jgi:hypothetical protein